MEHSATTAKTKFPFRERFNASGQSVANGEFEILAITAGQGNGWVFPRETLEESLPLWEGVETYIDHGILDGGRSLRDLAGICHSPAFDGDNNGIRLKLRATGPSGGLLEREQPGRLRSSRSKTGGYKKLSVVFQVSGS